MKQILAIALNDLRVEFSDRNTWLSFLILPLVFTAIIGFATGGFYRAPEDPRMAVAVVDLDGSALAKDFIAALETSEVVRPVAYAEAEALAALADDDVTAIVTLPAGFADGLLAGESVEVTLRTASGDNRSLAVSEAVQSASAQVSRAMLAAQFSVEEAEALRPFADDAERSAYFEEGLKLAQESAAAPPVELQAAQAPEAGEPQLTAFAVSSPGQLVTWVLATLLTGAQVLVAERTMGTLRRLVTMPAPRWSILGGKILGRFAMGLAQMAIMILFGQFVFGVKWGNSLPAMAMVAVCFGLAATALGLLLATLARTAEQAGGWASLGTFLLAPLGGAWIPLEITPAAFQMAAKILPTTWAMRGFTDVIVRGQGPVGVLLECGVLLGFAVLFFGLGIWKFKYE